MRHRSKLVMACMILGALSTASLVSAQTVEQQTLEAKYKKKLTKAFVKKVSWVQDLAEAQRMSKATGKPIFGYFTRSYSP